MTLLDRLPTPHRTGSLIILVMSLATLAIVFGFEYIGGYAPCELCWYQRYPYMVTTVLSAAALMTGGRPTTTSRTLIGLCAVVFMVGAGIAAFHVGVEQKWWKGLSSCSAPVIKSGDLDAVLQSIMAAPIVKCDDIAWSLFGISMAGYNFLLSLGLVALSGMTARAGK